MPPLMDVNAKPDEHNFTRMVDYLFQSTRIGVDGLLHGAVGLAGESGEVLDHMKKLWVYDKPLTEEVLAKIEEEMGDVIHYYFMLMIHLSEVVGKDYDLSYFFRNNMLKLSKRYPNGFTKQAALARADKDTRSMGDR